MDFKPKNKLLELKSETVQYIRNQYNLNKPEQTEEAVNIIHKWVQKQKHFKKKDFSLLYYEMYIITCEGSLERTKKQIDTICTTRTLLPRFFENCNVKTDLGKLHDYVKISKLPQLTEDHCRVDIYKVVAPLSKSFDYMHLYKFNIIYAEYVRIHDYANGYVFVFDIRETNLMNLLANLNLVDLREAMFIYINGYGLKIKGIHLVSTSKLLELLVTIVKQFMNPKLGEKIFIHKSIKGVYAHIPKSILPKDYGGKERSLGELRDDWLYALSSEEHLKYMRDINAAGTDEKYRRKDEFNDKYAGIPGTFKMLNID